MYKCAPNVYVICGPTAVGKGTVIREILTQCENIWLSVSATTRSPRPGEINGKDYFFVTDTQFIEMIEQNNMLEWAVVHKKHRYGTPAPAVNEALISGKTVILEVDIAGARQIRKSLPDATQIFIAPPSWADLESRLRGRGTEAPVEQERRLETARVEMQAQNEFDYVVTNDSVANATRRILQIMQAS